MSIVERLFPASELCALGYYDDLDQDRQRPPHKKRRLDSTDSVHSRRSRDSGYSSDEADEYSDEIYHISLEDQNSPKSSKRTRHENVPEHLSILDPMLLQKYLNLMHPNDQARFPYSAQTTLSTQRQPPQLQSRPKSHMPKSKIDHAGYSNPGLVRGWTAGPRSACSAQLSTRIFDGIRITSQEQSLLHSLIPGQTITQPRLPKKIPCSEESRDDSVQRILSLHDCIIMPSHDFDEEDDDEEYDEDDETNFSDENGDLEKFFNMDEAASEEGFPSPPLQ